MVTTSQNRLLGVPEEGRSPPCVQSSEMTTVQLEHETQDLATKYLLIFITPKHPTTQQIYTKIVTLRVPALPWV